MKSYSTYKNSYYIHQENALFWVTKSTALRLLLICMAFVFFSKIGYTQNEVFDIKEYSTQDGLIDKNVNQVELDSKKNIWILTRLGLMKFDRYSFTHIKKVDFSRRYKSIKIDENDLIWLHRVENPYTDFKEYNVDIYNPITDELKNISEVFPNIDSLANRLHFNYLTSDYENTIKLGQNRNKEIHYFKGKWYKKKLDAEANVVLPLYSINPATISYHNQSRDTFFSYSFLTESTLISTGKSAHFAFILDEEIVLTAQVDQKKPTSNYQLPEYNIFSKDGDFLKKIDFRGLKVESDRDNIIIYNSELVLFYNRNSQKLINITERLGRRLEKLVILDIKLNGNEIWIASNDGLLKILSTNSLFNHIGRNTDNSVRNIIQFDSTIIACTEYGLYQCNLSEGTSKLISTSFNFYSVLPYDDNELLITTFGSNIISWKKDNHGKIDVFQPTQLPTKEFKHITINHLYRTPSNEIIASTSKGIYKYDHPNKTIELYKATQGINAEQLIKNPDNLSKPFICTKTGLITFDLITHDVSKISELDEIQVSDIKQDVKSSTIYWIGTKDNGLLRWDKEKGTLKKYSIPEGFLSKNVHSINQIKNKIWCSTDYGISIFNKNNEEIITLTEVNGLYENEFNRHSHLKVNDSLIILGTVDGITYFNPLKEKYEYKNRSIKVKGIEFLNSKTGKVTFEPIMDNARLKLKLDQDYLNVNLLIEPGSNDLVNTYRYTSLDQRNQWSYTQDNKIKLSNLKIGDNTILLSRQMGVTEWSPIRRLQIRVKQPFYYRPYFYIAILISALSLAILILGINRRRQMAINMRIQKEVDNKTKSLQEKNEELLAVSNLNRKIFSIIGHDLRSPLISFGQITKSYSTLTGKDSNKDVVRIGKTLESNSKNLLNVVDKLLQWSNTRTKDKNNYQSIDPYAIVQEITTLFKNELIRKTIRLENNIHSEFRIQGTYHAIQTSLRNLIQNAIKYSPNGSIIRVESKINDRFYFLKVIDEGTGIRKETLSYITKHKTLTSTSGTSGETGLGIGLSLSMEVLKNLNAQLLFESNHPTGTIAIIKIPKF